MSMKKSAAILLAIGLSLSTAAGAAAAPGGHGGGGHFGGGAAGHFGGGHGGGHFGGHGGHGYGHGGHGYGGHGYGGFGYGLGFGLGLGALYYGYPFSDAYGYAPGPYYDYDDNYPDDSAVPGNAAPPPTPGTWYRCDSPAGYYPYVAVCQHPWQPVPAAPPPPPDDAN